MSFIWSIVFLVIFLLAAFFGFSGVLSESEIATGIAQILMVVFLVLFVASLLFADNRMDGGGC